MTLTAAARAELYKEQSSDVMVGLIKLDLSLEERGVFRFCTDTQPITVDHGEGSETYLASQISIVAPEQRESGTINARFFVPGAPDSFIRELSLIQFEPIITLKLVMRSSPNDIMQEHPNLRLKEFNGDALGAEFILRYEELSRTPFPRKRFNFNNYPGGFI